MKDLIEKRYSQLTKIRDFESSGKLMDELKLLKRFKQLETGQLDPEQEKKIFIQNGIIAGFSLVRNQHRHEDREINKKLNEGLVNRLSFNLNVDLARS